MTSKNHHNTMASENNLADSSRHRFIMNSSVLATSSALLTLSPIGHAVADLVLGPGEAPVVLGRLLLQDSCIAFNGERCDPVTGLYHLGQGYRAYNPGLMRFHAADSLSPFGEGGVNPYAYCLGDPVSLVDPTGHMSWQAGLGIGLGILGIIVAIATLGMGIKASVAMWGAAASVSASAIASTSLGVVSSALGLASSALGVASAALVESEPQLSANLGWASLGVGIASLATGL
ncbi:RHS repeat-associated core domain-containing protein [Aeromonas hydrophila]|uniref:RHS repeat-associated core domain-containing protein n=1 Tax=Aeromonas hydrophila TaxID=644 RepID=UPI0038D245C2